MAIKVCHLTSAHPRYDTRIFIKECQSLAKEGYEVSLVVADGKKDEVKNNIHIYDVGKKQSRLKRMLLSSRDVYKKAIEIDADIYHLHDPELLPIGLKLKKRNRKVIFDIHENTALQIKLKPWIHKAVRNVIAGLFALYEKRAVRKFDYLVVPQYSMQRYFEDINPKCLFLPNVVSLEFIPDISISDNITQKNKYYLTYVGGLTTERGLFNMLNVMEFLPSEYHLRFVGSISDKDLENARNHKEWGRVDYLGFVPHEDIKQYLKDSFVGLILFQNSGQYYYSYSIKLFEYMGFGLPVIMPDFGDWISFNERYKCGINVTTTDSKTIAEHIIELTKKLDYQNELRKNSREAIENGLNWETFESELIKFYKNLLINE